MTYGFQMFRDDQSLIMDSSHKGGVFIEILTIPHNQTSSKTYTNVVGGSLYFLVLKAGRHSLMAQTNAYSQAVLSWEYATESGGETIVAVFAKKFVGNSNEYGLLLLNNQEEVVANEFNTRPQYLGTVQPSATPVEALDIPNGTIRYTHRVATGSVGSSNMLVFFLCPIPDTATVDVWYSWTPWMYGTGTDADLYVYAPSGTTYNIPTLHMYSVNTPPTASESWGLQLIDSSGQTTFISSEKNMVVNEEFNFNFPTLDATSAYTVNMPTNAGIFLPRYEIIGFDDGTYIQSYVGVVKRAGNQLVFKTLEYAEKVKIAGEPDPKFRYGNKNGNFGVVVDLAKYSAGSVGNLPPSSTQSPPTITSHPSSQSAQAGTQVTFTVAANGNPAPTFKWMRNDVIITGATSSSYTFTAASGDNGAVYKAVATNTHGSVASNGATLTISTSTFTAAYVSSHPSDATVAEGNSVTLYCGGGGTAPLSYQWFSAGTSGTTYVAISGATSNSYNPPTSAGNSGKRYFCRVSNISNGTTYTDDSNMATITLTGATSGYPVISQHPVDQTTTVGSQVYFSVSAAPVTGYTWHKNGITFGGNSSSCAPDVGSTAESGSQYFCRVWNGGVYTDSNVATLTVNEAPGKPVISVQPTGGTVSVGASKLLRCVASPVTSYTWYKDNIVFATGQDTYADTSSGAEGTVSSYYCIASNNGQETKSNTVTVTVGTPV